MQTYDGCFVLIAVQSTVPEVSEEVRYYRTSKANSIRTLVGIGNKSICWFAGEKEIEAKQ